MKELSALLNRTFEYYQEIQHKNYVVNPAIPILYFGDVNAYFKSEIKIITVGKNPSSIEFRRNKSEPYSFLRIEFIRFDKKNGAKDRKTPYIVYQHNLLLNTNKVSKVYFGKAGIKPFIDLSNVLKQELGRKILTEH